MTEVQKRSVAQPTITRQAASALVRAAVEAAARNAVEIAVAVTDVGGQLVAFERTDGARFLAVDVAIDKAWTAVSSGMATHAWNAVLRGKPDVAPLANHPRLLGVAGGLPITEDGKIIGGLGVSGGSHVQDQIVAEQALSAAGLAA